MKMNEFDDYTSWMLNYIRTSELNDYSSLISFLDEETYLYVIPLDSNRASSAYNMRRRFSYDYGIEDEDVRSGNASVLEVLIALSNYIYDTYEIHYPAYWFWLMVANLNVKYNDDEWDEATKMDVHKKLMNWMTHQYDMYGNGTPFPIDNPDTNLTALDLFSQMNEYITKNYI